MLGCHEHLPQPNSCVGLSTNMHMLVLLFVALLSFHTHHRKIGCEMCTGHIYRLFTLYKYAYCQSLLRTSWGTLNLLVQVKYNKNLYVV